MAEHLDDTFDTYRIEMDAAIQPARAAGVAA